MNLNKCLLIAFFALTNSIDGFAQKEANIWYFGNQAGIDFSDGKPKGIAAGSAMNSKEGCATIATSEGQILFYTNGATIWNKENKIMKNGDGLKGDPSSTQAAIALKKPNANNLYYVFTTDKLGNSNGLQYNVVDIKQDKGLGAVTTKNVQLHKKVTEKLTAVYHRNGKDIWVVAHEWESDAFLAYLLTSSGVSSTPVISRVGSKHEGDTVNTQGYMKVSPDGTQLALAVEKEDFFELFDFDNSTGKVSNPIRFNPPRKSYAYGVEFSPNGAYLYCAAAKTGMVYQYNLHAGSPEEIENSAQMIGGTVNSKWIGALQLGPDGKIYFPIYNTSYLGVINEPNRFGGGVQYQNDAVYLEGFDAKLGLPTFFQSLFSKPFEEIVLENFLGKLAMEKRMVLHLVHFDLGDAKIKTSGHKQLDQIVSLLTDNPNVNLKITGHTDHLGNKNSNMILSNNRAQAVVNYLIDKGISKDRLFFKGLGSSEPIADNNSPEGQQKNRRVEILFTFEKGFN